MWDDEQSFKFHSRGANGVFLVNKYPQNSFSTNEPIPTNYYRSIQLEKRKHTELQTFFGFHVRGATEEFRKKFPFE
jgi:hypothetical protein